MPGTNKNAATEAAAFRFSRKVRLEVDASAQLKLPGRINEVTVGAVGNSKSCGIEIQTARASSSGCCDTVAGGTETSDVGVIGEVEQIGQQLHVISLSNLHAL